MKRTKIGNGVLYHYPPNTIPFEQIFDLVLSQKPLTDIDVEHFHHICFKKVWKTRFIHIQSFFIKASSNEEIRNRFHRALNSRIDSHRFHCMSILLNSHFIHSINEKLPLVVRATFKTKQVRRFIQKALRSKEPSVLSFGIRAVAMLGQCYPNLIEKDADKWIQSFQVMHERFPSQCLFDHYHAVSVMLLLDPNRDIFRSKIKQIFEKKSPEEFSYEWKIYQAYLLPPGSVSCTRNKYGREECHGCGKQGEKMMVCGGCKTVTFCSRECQKSNWKDHKSLCKQIKSFIQS